MLKRQIKFRAWDKNNKCWANLNELSDWGSASFTACIGFGNNKYPYHTFRIESDDRYIIQEFTGLLDKNGKEIFEGDILQHTKADGTKIIKGYVEFLRGGYRVVRKELDTTWPLLGYAKNCEVIGNIFENTNLLTK
jgi:uncharacterized phage protein (TIGR01671 family)